MLRSACYRHGALFKGLDELLSTQCLCGFPSSDAHLVNNIDSSVQSFPRAQVIQTATEQA